MSGDSARLLHSTAFAALIAALSIKSPTPAGTAEMQRSNRCRRDKVVGRDVVGRGNAGCVFDQELATSVGSEKSAMNESFTGI
jgi:hypothetical protein